MGEWLESFTSKMTQSPNKVLFLYVLERLKNGYTSMLREECHGYYNVLKAYKRYKASCWRSLNHPCSCPSTLKI